MTMIRSTLVAYLALAAVVLPLGSSEVAFAQSADCWSLSASEDQLGLTTDGAQDDGDLTQILGQLKEESLESAEQSAAEHERKSEDRAWVDGVAVASVIMIIAVVVSAFAWGAGNATALPSVFVASMIADATNNVEQTSETLLIEGMETDLSVLLAILDDALVAVQQGDSLALESILLELDAMTVDVDGDGVPNDDDGCPLAPGPASLDGCPA